MPYAFSNPQSEILSSVICRLSSDFRPLTSDLLLPALPAHFYPRLARPLVSLP
jgi:hypothetical protein